MNTQTTDTNTRRHFCYQCTVLPPSKIREIHHSPQFSNQNAILRPHLHGTGSARSLYETEYFQD